MANDREQELERLEQELLADILKDMKKDDDLLSDIPVELLDSTHVSWEEVDEAMRFEQPEAPTQEIQEPMKQPNKKKTGKAAKAREDKTVISLMLLASFLCLGIIGVMVYWLELLPA